MKKKLFILIVLSFFIIGISSIANDNVKRNNVDNESVSVFEQEKNNEAQIKQDDVWCITFQLVWNEFMDKFLKSKPVMFKDGNPDSANLLNKRLYTKDDISLDSYYIAQGKLSNSLKKQIEKDIYNKFKEKSDILNKINWNVKNSYLFYAMLKKEFKFLIPFDILPAASFNDSEQLVKYFGINKKSKKDLHKNVKVLFYNTEDEYAVKLLTKNNEEVILYRTDKKDSFENLYSYVQNNAKDTDLESNDILLVPEIDVDKLISYDELCNKQIIGTNYVITQALQTIKFKLDNKGGKLKSEAAMVVMKMALEPPVRNRQFLYNRPFVLFLKENSKNKPYYAMAINNTDYLVMEK